MPIVIKFKNNNVRKTMQFESVLDDIELVNDFFIKRFDKEFVFYEILFNGSVQNFINIMQNKDYNLNTQKKVWTME